MQASKAPCLEIRAKETTTPIVVKCPMAPAGEREFSITWEELAALKRLAQRELTEQK